MTRCEYRTRRRLVLALLFVIAVAGCRENTYPDDMTTIRIYAREYQWCASNREREASIDDCALRRLVKSLSASGLVSPPHLADLIDIWREVAYLTQVQGWTQAMADAALERRLERRAN